MHGHVLISGCSGFRGSDYIPILSSCAVNLVDVFESEAFVFMVFEL